MKQTNKFGNKIKKIAWIVSILIGVIIIVLGLIQNIAKTDYSDIIFNVCISIGCSLIASSVFAKLVSYSEKYNMEDLFNKEIETLNAIKHSIPNDRIIKGMHLKQEFPNMLDTQCISTNDVLKVDVVGMELNNFWKDQSQRLRECSQFNIRLIVQNPFSPFFEQMVREEGKHPESIAINILKLSKEIEAFNKSLNPRDKRKKVIELKWISMPATVTITKVNSQLCVRSRLIKGQGRDLIEFFEKYTAVDIPFTTYSNYFENLWEKADDYINNKYYKYYYEECTLDPAINSTDTNKIRIVLAKYNADWIDARRDELVKVQKKTANIYSKLE